MQLPGVAGQYRLDHLYDASGVIASGGTSQRLLPQHRARSYLIIINTSSGPLYVDFGGPRATATLTNGVVTSIAVNNAGQGFTLPPTVSLMGGGPPEKNTLTGLSSTAPQASPPSNRGSAVAIMTGSAPNLSITSISVTNGGSGYLQAPYVLIQNRPGDDNGVCLASATSIPLLTQGSVLCFEDSMCPTDAVAIFGSTTNASFVCKFMY